MIKALIDSSSWIHFFNRRSSWHYQTVSQVLLEGRAVTCGIVTTEVLRGARHVQEQEILKEHFLLLEFIPIEQEDYFEAAALGFKLARKGITVKTIDLLIATLASKHRLILIHQDSDFELMARHFPLKILSEPKSSRV